MQNKKLKWDTKEHGGGYSQGLLSWALGGRFRRQGGWATLRAVAARKKGERGGWQAPWVCADGAFSPNVSWGLSLFLSDVCPCLGMSFPPGKSLLVLGDCYGLHFAVRIEHFLCPRYLFPSDLDRLLLVIRIWFFFFCPPMKLSLSAGNKNFWDSKSKIIVAHINLVFTRHLGLHKSLMRRITFYCPYRCRSWSGPDN